MFGMIAELVQRAIKTGSGAESFRYQYFERFLAVRFEVIGAVQFSRESHLFD